MHKKLLAILELIESEEVAYKHIYITEYGFVLRRGTHLPDVDIKTFDYDYHNGFTVAILQEKHENLRETLAPYEVHTHLPRQDLIKEANGYSVTYINIR